MIREVGLTRASNSSGVQTIAKRRNQGLRSHSGYREKEREEQRYSSTERERKTYQERPAIVVGSDCRGEGAERRRAGAALGAGAQLNSQHSQREKEAI